MTDATMAPPAGPEATAKNWMGITSLVTALVGLSLAGVIFGHLGLGAAKRGEANNRGLALAGTIIGYIGLALTTVFVLLFFGIFAVVASTAHTQTDARLDASTLGYLVSIYYVDNATPPSVTFHDGVYDVAGSTLEAKLDDPRVTFEGSTSANWCVTVEASPGSAIVASYGSVEGLVDGAHCGR